MVPWRGGPEPWKLTFKESADMVLTGREARTFMKMSRDFGLRGRYYFKDIYVIFHEASRYKEFIPGWRYLQSNPLIREAKFVRISTIARAITSTPLSMTAWKGVLPGSFELVIFGSGIAIDAGAAILHHDVRALKQIVSDAPAEFGKLATEIIASALAAALAAGLTGVAIVPITAAFSAGIAVDCLLDELGGQESKCSAAASWVDRVFR